MSVRTENLIIKKRILSFHTKQEQSSGHTGKLVTLRRGCQQHALFYIIHMKNAIFTNILFIVFGWFFF